MIIKANISNRLYELNIFVFRNKFTGEQECIAAFYILKYSLQSNELAMLQGKVYLIMGCLPLLEIYGDVAFTSLRGKKAGESILNTVTVHSEIDCALKCYRNDTCNAVNIG